jgi:hypothetical protein
MDTNYYNFIFNQYNNKKINKFKQFYWKLKENILFLKYVISFIFPKWSKWKIKDKKFIIGKIFIYLNHVSIFYYLEERLNNLKFYYYYLYRFIYLCQYRSLHKVDPIIEWFIYNDIVYEYCYNTTFFNKNLKRWLKNFIISSKFIKKNKNWYEIFF